MTLEKKDKSGIEGIFFSAIYSEKEVDEEKIEKEAYANMHIVKNERIISTFFYYNDKDALIMVHIHILNNMDRNYNTKEVLDLAKCIKNKRKMKIESTKIGRNEFCPCGSGKKYKHCCGK